MSIASLISAGTSLFSAISNANSTEDQIALAKEQLEETQKQNKWEREKYETALANQTEGITALGNVFGSVLDSQNSSTDSTSTTNTTATDSSITGSTTNASSLDNASTNTASTDSSTSSLSASQGTQDSSVPTQRT